VAPVAPVTERFEVASVPQLFIAVAAAEPPAKEGRLVQVAGKEKRYRVPLPGHVPAVLFAVTVDAVPPPKDGVMLMKLDAFAATLLMPTDAPKAGVPAGP